MGIKAPKGTKDILPQDSYKWQYIESVVRELTALFGYREVRTPVFEHTELFLRGVGDTTDIVQKEMYTFEDKGHRSITLKPEGTAGVVRAFIESGMAGGPQPTKMYYLSTPVFRYERPQSGRLREHHQFGIEVFGAPDSSVDAEVISVALKLFERLGIGNLRLNINSIGCPECRPVYHEKLKEFLRQNFGSLCPTCKERFEKNPLRILDCKEEGCKALVKEAPLMVDFLCEECETHFGRLKAYLGALDIAYSINPFIVRGLDYYTKTVFEIISDNIGAQGTVCGGGRYDKLVQEIGGPDMAGIGFGLGIERLLLVLEQEGIEIPQPTVTEVYVCSHGEAARLEAAKLVAELRQNAIKADMDHVGRSIKAQFKYAGKLGVRKVLVLGEEELEKNTAVLKNMENGEELVVNRDVILKMI
ncbi:histidine--tRNA ligase [Christensenellaceae bacterium OttesenSCG-928-K19]|nr:histidine--tRNA ligase [Christensenellaceae bacterium OttesenSCG-928-K19]